jgi:hypothetical protein
MNSQGRALQFIAVGFFACVALVMACSEESGVDSHTHSASDITSGTLDNGRLNMGTGNGMDADMVDGMEASAFAQSAHAHDGTDITSGTIANARLDTGSGNGLDADMVDGMEAAAFVATAGDTMTGNLNLSGNSLLDFRVENASAPPASASAANAGRMYYDTTSNRLFYSDGTNWVPMGGAGSPVLWVGGSSTSNNTSGTWQTYPLDVTDHDTSGSTFSVNTNGTITVNTAGYYQITAWTEAYCSGSTNYAVSGRIRKNATTDMALSIFQHGDALNQPCTGTHHLRFLGYCASGDTFQVQYQAQSGSTWNHDSHTNGASGVHVEYLGQ